MPVPAENRKGETLTLGARRPRVALGQGRNSGVAASIPPAGTMSRFPMRRVGLLPLRWEPTVEGHGSQFRLMFKSIVWGFYSKYFHNLLAPKKIKCK